MRRLRGVALRVVRERQRARAEVEQASLLAADDSPSKAAGADDGDAGAPAAASAGADGSSDARPAAQGSDDKAAAAAANTAAPPSKPAVGQAYLDAEAQRVAEEAKLRRELRAFSAQGLRRVVVSEAGAVCGHVHRLTSNGEAVARWLVICGLKPKIKALYGFWTIVSNRATQRARLPVPSLHGAPLRLLRCACCR